MSEGYSVIFLYMKLDGPVTFAVLKSTFLQSGKMLTDHAGKWYDMFRNTTVLSSLSSVFARNAEHAPDPSLYTLAYNECVNSAADRLP